MIEKSTTASLSRRAKFFYGLFILVAFVAGIVLAKQLQQWRAEEGASPAGVAAYGGDFQLMSVQGSRALTDYRGKLVLIYFGFTACPDVCPTAMGSLKAAVSLLSEQEQSKLQGILISLDPERDTAEKTDSYARYFNPGFLGLTGSVAEIAQVARQYGVLYQKVVAAESALDYTLDHSSVIYLVDQQGVLREKVKHGTTPAELAALIRQYL